MVRWNPTPLLVALLLLAAGCTTPERDPDQAVAVETTGGANPHPLAPTFGAFVVMWTSAQGQERVATFDKVPLLAVEFDAHRAIGDQSYTSAHPDLWQYFTRVADGVDYDPDIRCYRFILEHQETYTVALCGQDAA